MYEANEHWKQYRKEKELAKAKQEMDKFLNKIKKLCVCMK